MTEPSEATAPSIDTGTGYGRPQPTYDERMTHVGPGTPMGELLRRYWHPFARVEDATNVPKEVRLLGEDLVLFRDGTGTPGLVAARCAHRGANLYFGRVEDEGIRCCYHGWLFDAEGNCLDQATEIDGGRRRDLARQPWYPVDERYGLIFAYMGPPDRKPVLPRWAAFENIPEGKVLEQLMNPGYGDGFAIPCNWLQSMENTQDQMHVLWLHNAHSGTQFTFEDEFLPPLPDDLDLHLAQHFNSWESTEGSVVNSLTAPAGPGKLVTINVESILPNIVCVPGHTEVAWIVPIDDTHHGVIQLGVSSRPGQIDEHVGTHGGKYWKDATSAERRQYPGDYETQVGQGPITFHSEEHLVGSDRGVNMVRGGLRRMLEMVEAGENPPNISFDPNAEPIVTRANAHIWDMPEMPPAELS